MSMSVSCLASSPYKVRYACQPTAVAQLRVRERFAQKFSTFLILKTSILNLARTDASKIPIINSPLHHQNQICGGPPIADHSRRCLSAIEKAPFLKRIGWI